MQIYESCSLYIASASDLKAKITRLDAIITALEVSAATGATTANITELDLDTGQSKIKVLYRSMTEVYQAIQGFETLKNKYINKLNGRGRRLVPSQNFNGPRF